ncbi:MAG: hypothetical protein AB1916_04615 [Thermodesulfobacteriota bacterium]
MDHPTYEHLREEVETRYQKKKGELDALYQDLERWRHDKLVLLEVAHGKRSAEEWLDDMPGVPSTPSPPAKSPQVTPAPPTEIKSPDRQSVNQSREVRNAVLNISGDISNEKVRDWLAANRPSIAEQVTAPSIRSQLARLEMSGKLQVITMGPGGMKIYRKTEGNLLPTS